MRGFRGPRLRCRRDNPQILDGQRQAVAFPVGCVVGGDLNVVGIGSRDVLIEFQDHFHDKIIAIDRAVRVHDSGCHGIAGGGIHQNLDAVLTLAWVRVHGERVPGTTRKGGNQGRRCIICTGVKRAAEGWTTQTHIVCFGRIQFQVVRQSDGQSIGWGAIRCSHAQGAVDLVVGGPTDLADDIPRGCAGFTGEVVVAGFPGCTAGPALVSAAILAALLAIAVGLADALTRAVACGVSVAGAAIQRIFASIVFLTTLERPAGVGYAVLDALSVGACGARIAVAAIQGAAASVVFCAACGGATGVGYAVCNALSVGAGRAWIA